MQEKHLETRMSFRAAGGTQRMIQLSLYDLSFGMSFPETCQHTQWIQTRFPLEILP